MTDQVVEDVEFQANLINFSDLTSLAYYQLLVITGFSSYVDIATSVVLRDPVIERKTCMIAEDWHIDSEMFMKNSSNLFPDLVKSEWSDRSRR